MLLACVASVMRKIIFSLLCALTSQSHAVDIVKCSNEEEVFIRELNAAKRLSKEMLVAEVEDDPLIQKLLQCELKDDVMMDGLSFTLYKGINNDVVFVRVHNNFDGTSKLYGPFNTAKR